MSFNSVCETVRGPEGADLRGHLSCGAGLGRRQLQPCGYTELPPNNGALSVDAATP